MPRVVVVQPYVPRYRVEFHEGLRAALAEDGITVDLVCSAPLGDAAARGDGVDLPWATTVAARGFGPFVHQRIGSLIGRADLVIISSALSNLHLYPLVARGRRGGPPLAFWDHGVSHRSAGLDSPAERLKRWIWRRARWWFAYTEAGKRAVAATGFDPARITVVQNAIDTGALRGARAGLTEHDRQAARTALGLGPGQVAAFVGGLYREKRIALLLDAAAAVRAKIPDFQLLVIGDGPERARVEAAAAAHDWIVAVGHREGTDKVRDLSVACLLLMPGRVGLAVLDSFALELPLVTMAGSAHAPEIEYLHDGVNGVVVPGEGPEAYAAAVASLLADDVRRARLSEGCRQAAATYTVEAMIERFRAGVVAALRS